MWTWLSHGMPRLLAKHYSEYVYEGISGWGPLTLERAICFTQSMIQMTVTESLEFSIILRD